MTHTVYVRSVLILAFFGLFSISVLLAGLPFQAKATHLETAAQNLQRIPGALHTGSSGDDVKALQAYLIAEGLLPIKEPTGYYGPLTDRAVDSLKTRHHVIEDGFGPMTRAALAGAQMPTGNDAKIMSAMSAAPTRVSENATILDWPTAASSGFVTLRQGSSSWSCLPDDPATPGKDPLCGDANVMKFFDAWMKKETPQLSQAGIAYMLQGGSDQSNTDPYATAPEGGMHMYSPPHIMIFPTTPPDPNVYGTNPNSGGPWVMWANTPYAHLMIPVK